MINIIMCEDNIRFSENTKEMITDYLKSNNIKNKILTFTGYNEKLHDIIYNNERKIYLLDIELNGRSGLDIANEIRDTGDWESVIIIFTTHSEMIGQTIKRRIQILDYIVKYDEYNERLIDNIAKGIEIITNKEPHKIESKKKVDYVNPKEILYIEKEVSTNKSIIHLKSFNKIIVEKNLNELFEIFKTILRYSHRGCLINMKNVREIDFPNKVITFINGETTNLMSRSFKKEMRKHAKQ